MRKLINDFFDRYFHDEESIILVVLLASGLFFLLALGEALAPLITAIIIAYLMQGLVGILLRLGINRRWSFLLVYLVFIGTFVLILFIVLPQVWNQFGRFVNELPRLISQWQAALMQLPQNYPNLVSEQQLADLFRSARGEVAVFGQAMLSYSISSIPTVIYWIIYIILVPILVFFVMKDKEKLMQWTGNFLPRNRPLMIRIWQEMDHQLSNYIRGKALEIVIVGSVSFVAFLLLKIEYALLLSVLVGFSVLIPYIGATAVTLPIAAVAYVQWGVGGEFYTTLIVYGVIQLLDGNVLVPIIFSEAVNLHPVAIITAVLVFGGIWGLAGVFFAIPLATLIKAIINSWPSKVQSMLSANNEG